jgi:hypothetical protein
VPLVELQPSARRLPGEQARGVAQLALVLGRGVDRREIQSRAESGGRVRCVRDERDLVTAAAQGPAEAHERQHVAV